MNIINVSKKVNEKEAKALIGTFATDKDYDVLVEKETLAIDENGNELFSFIPSGIPNNIAKEAYKPLVKGATHTNNRGSATHKDSMEYAVKKDGTRSKTNRSTEEVKSGIAGYFDRYTRHPFCRLTGYTEKYPDDWMKIVPLIKKVDEHYAKYCPKTYKMQRAKADNCSQDFIIKGTAYSTCTINRNWRTSYHKDAKNLNGGMAGMTVVGSGSYTGGYLCFPEYRVAVNVRSTDVIVMNNTHLIHGNTKIKAKQGNYNRVSVVCYLREGMLKCGSMEEEIARAKKHGAFITRELEDEKN